MREIHAMASVLEVRGVEPLSYWAPCKLLQV